jgi:hypothetical protein
MEVLAPTDSVSVGEENEEMVETETLVLCRIQFMTLALGEVERVGATKGTSNDPFSGVKVILAQILPYVSARTFVLVRHQ